MRSRKAQSAVEYLVTHGWAIVLLLVVLVILYSMDAFNPKTYAAEDCYFQPGFGCERFVLGYQDIDPLFGASGGPPAWSARAKFRFWTNLTNNLGYDIVITGMTFTAVDLVVEGRGECIVTTNMMTADFSYGFPRDYTKSAVLTPCFFYIGPGTGATVPNNFLILNGETLFEPFYLAMPGATTRADYKPACPRIGEVKEIIVTFNYVNCNAGNEGDTGRWNKGFYTPYSLTDVGRNNLWHDCIENGMLPHTMVGKIMARVQPGLDREDACR